MAYRIGVTGSGFMGRTHVEAAHRLADTEIVAVAGGRRAAQLAADYGIEEVETVEAMIDREDLDAIVISTPHHCHHAEALRAAERGKHCLVEKPLATSTAHAREMATAFQGKGLTLSVGYHQRFRESNKTVRRLVAEGAIGPVRCVQTSALFDIEKMRKDSGFGGDWSWWKDPRSVAHLINSAPHTVDLCRWWLDAEITSVAAQCGVYREPDNPNENTTMALLHFDSGAAASFWSSSVVASPGFPGEDFRFRLMGDRGLIDANPYDEIRLANRGEWEVVYKQPPVGFEDSNAAFGDARMQAYCDQMQAFVDAIGSDEGVSGKGVSGKGVSGKGAGSARDGVVAVAVVMAILESSESGRTVAVDA